MSDTFFPMPVARQNSQPAKDPLSDYAINLYYRFGVDRYDLGVFTSINGLGVELQVQTIEEGGGGTLVHQLVGRPKYENLELKRPVNPDTKKVMAWLNSTIRNVSPATASLAALTPSGQVICEWNLAGVIPARWTGPSFDASGSPQAAMETLVVAYQGFL